MTSAWIRAQDLRRNLIAFASTLCLYALAFTGAWLLSSLLPDGLASVPGPVILDLSGPEGEGPLGQIPLGLENAPERPPGAPPGAAPPPAPAPPPAATSAPKTSTSAVPLPSPGPLPAPAAIPSTAAAKPSTAAAKPSTAAAKPSTAVAPAPSGQAAAKTPTQPISQPAAGPDSSVGAAPGAKTFPLPGPAPAVSSAPQAATAQPAGASSSAASSSPIAAAATAPAGTASTPAPASAAATASVAATASAAAGSASAASSSPEIQQAPTPSTTRTYSSGASGTGTTDGSGQPGGLPGGLPGGTGSLAGGLPGGTGNVPGVPEGTGTVTFKGSEMGNALATTFGASQGKVGRNMYVPIWMYMPLPVQIDDAIFQKIATKETFREYYQASGGVWRQKKTLPLGYDRSSFWDMLENAGYNVAEADFKAGKALKPVILEFSVSPVARGRTELLDLRIVSSSGSKEIDDAVLYGFKQSKYYNSMPNAVSGRFSYSFESQVQR